MGDLFWLFFFEWYMISPQQHPPPHTQEHMIPFYSE